MEFQEYPKWLYLNGDVNQSRLVDNAEQEEALGDQWIDQSRLVDNAEQEEALVDNAEQEEALGDQWIDEIIPPT